MSWEAMKRAREEGASNFIKLKDGESIEGVFRGEPYLFYQTFKDPNEYHEWAEGRSFKFKINFITRENGQSVAKIFQGGAKIRDALIDAKDEYGLDCVFKIKRTGSGKEDTRYSVLFKVHLSPEQMSVINNVPLLPLVKNENGNQKQYDEDPFEPDGDVPF